MLSFSFQTHQGDQGPLPPVEGVCLAHSFSPTPTKGKISVPPSSPTSSTDNITPTRLAPAAYKKLTQKWCLVRVSDALTLLPTLSWAEV